MFPNFEHTKLFSASPGAHSMVVVRLYMESLTWTIVGNVLGEVYALCLLKASIVDLVKSIRIITATTNLPNSPYFVSGSQKSLTRSGNPSLISNLYIYIYIYIEEGHLLIENVVNIFFVTSLSVSLHNLLDFYNLFGLCCIVMSRRSVFFYSFRSLVGCMTFNTSEKLNNN